jgi:hypothetical protein
MTVLKSLTFATLPKSGANPVLNRRTATISRLEEQKMLLDNPSYIRVSQRWTKKDGERVQVERKQRVTAWWRLDASGAYLFFIRSGGRPIEFDKGKTAISVPSKDKIPAVIDTLITAVRNGELDGQLMQSRPKAAPKARKTA